MSEGYHPEIDDSALCNDEDSARYRYIIGCCVWIIVLGRLDITYATSAIMSRFNMPPREAHLKAVKRILSYCSERGLFESIFFWFEIQFTFAQS